MLTHGIAVEYKLVGLYNKNVSDYRVQTLLHRITWHVTLYSDFLRRMQSHACLTVLQHV